jgi:hypothetical protein
MQVKTEKPVENAGCSNPNHVFCAPPFLKDTPVRRFSLVNRLHMRLHAYYIVYVRRPSIRLKMFLLRQLSDASLHTANRLQWLRLEHVARFFYRLSISFALKWLSALDLPPSEYSVIAEILTSQRIAGKR